MFGGTLDGQTNQAAAVYDVEANLWTELPDLPESLGSSHGAGLAFGRPFVVGCSSLYAYDPFNGTWSTIPLPAADFWYAATVQGEVFLVGDRNGQLEIHHLLTLPDETTTPLPPATAYGPM